MTDRVLLVADHLDPREYARQELGNARGTSHAIGDYQRPVGVPVDPRAGMPAVNLPNRAIYRCNLPGSAP